MSAPLYEIERFQIQDYFVNNMRFVVVDLGSMTKSDGLLGMNFLKAFDFEIDQQNDLLILAPR